MGLQRRLSEDAGMGSSVVLTVSTICPSLAQTQTLRASLVTRSRARPGRHLSPRLNAPGRPIISQLAAVGPRKAAHTKLPTLGTREGWW